VATSPRVAQATAVADPSPSSNLNTGIADLDSLLAEYRKIKGLSQMLLISKDKVIGGQFSISPAELLATISELDEYFNLLGGELRLKRHKMAIYSMKNKGLIIAWPSIELKVVVVSDLNSLGLISQKLSRDMDTISNLVQASIA